MTQSFPTIAEFLKSELEKRTKRNASYSLRAFARDIEVSPSHLSEVLNKGRGISRTSIRQISSALKLSRSQTEYLCDLADIQFSRNEDVRKFAVSRLKQAENAPEIYEFDRDSFQMIADWYHLGILTLMETDSFIPDIEWIAKRLDLPINDIIEATQRLERLGLIEINDDGSWKLTKHQTTVPDKTAPEAMRKFHSQILEKAAQAIERTPREQRFLQAHTFSIAPEAFHEIVEAMRECQAKIAAINEKYRTRRDVYTLAMQLFPLSQKVDSDDKTQV